MVLRRARVAGLVAAALLLASGCSFNQPLLGNVRETPPPFSPATNQLQNHFDVSYQLSRAATISASVQGANGGHWDLYQDVQRPAAGNYVLEFDGTVAGPGPNERSALPDGSYSITLVASADGKQSQQVVPITIQGADPTPAQVTNLTVSPATISPNADAQDDVTHVSYQISKKATVQPFADQVQSDGSLKRLYLGAPTPVQPGAQQFIWDGTSNSTLLPNGSYQFGIRATDASGSVSETSVPFAIQDAGTPDAQIIFARIGPGQITFGGQVCLDTTVRNSGQTTLRTQGPDPSYVYNSLDTFSSIADHQYTEKAGLWRVGMDWGGSSDTTGAKFPYRWGLGHDLAPGEQVDLHVCVQVQNEQTSMYFFGGLIQEDVALMNAGAGLTQINVSS